jgi:hypothetical protein
MNVTEHIPPGIKWYAVHVIVHFINSVSLAFDIVVRLSDSGRCFMLPFYFQ